MSLLYHVPPCCGPAWRSSQAEKMSWRCSWRETHHRNDGAQRQEPRREHLLGDAPQLTVLMGRADPELKLSRQETRTRASTFRCPCPRPRAPGGRPEPRPAPRVALGVSDPGFTSRAVPSPQLGRGSQLLFSDRMATLTPTVFWNDLFNLKKKKNSWKTNLIMAADRPILEAF